MLPSREYVGGVPIVVRLSEQDVLHAREAPAPVAFVLPRTTLLLAVLRDVLHSVAPYTAALSPYTTQVWFVYRGRHVPWLYPVGAIKDYISELRYHALCQQKNSSSNCSDDSVGNDDKDAATRMLSTMVSVLGQPLELELRVHQTSKHSVVERGVALFVDGAHLDEYIWNEVRQLHKAAYTAIYGAYKLYQNEAEATLRPAVAMALYRPFVDDDDAAGDDDDDDGDVAGDDGAVVPTPLQQQQQQQAAATTTAAAADGAATRSSARSEGDSAATLAMRALARNRDTSSPYLLAEYAQLLRGPLSRLPRAAYLVYVAYPFAYGNVDDGSTAAAVAAAAASNSSSRRGGGGDVAAREAEVLRFCLRRVSAAPASLSDATSAVDTVVGDDGGSDAVTLGVLLWRLYCAPCLRWRQEQQQQQQQQQGQQDANATMPATATTAAAVVDDDDDVRARQHALLASLARFYDDAPADVTLEALEQHDVLRSGVVTSSSSSSPPAQLLPPPSWARWEREGVARLVAAYEGADGGEATTRRERGIALVDVAAAGRTTRQPQTQRPRRRIVFAVQDTAPSLRTPASFLEAHLASSDRALYIVVQVR